MKLNSDTINNFLDSLEQQPILKGAVPAVAGVAVSFFENVEQWLRITGLAIGILIGLVTLYLKMKQAFRG